MGNNRKYVPKAKVILDYADNKDGVKNIRLRDISDGGHARTPARLKLRVENGNELIAKVIAGGRKQEIVLITDIPQEVGMELHGLFASKR